MCFFRFWLFSEVVLPHFFARVTKIQFGITWQAVTRVILKENENKIPQLSFAGKITEKIPKLMKLQTFKDAGKVGQI